MSTPDEIRADIERTRGELGSDVDALADKVSPSQIAHRQTEKVKSRFQGVRDSVMGAADSARSSASGSASGASDQAKDVAHRGVEKAKGNPLAVGLIAFGAGWLASSLIPTSDKEEELAGELKDRTAPLVDKAKEQAKDASTPLIDAAKEHAQDLKGTAQDAAQTVKGQAQGAASDVKDHAQSAKDDVQHS
jgi:cell division septum initiation protein DivIVA